MKYRDMGEGSRLVLVEETFELAEGAFTVSCLVLEASLRII